MLSFAKSVYLNWRINTTGYKRQYGHWTNLNMPVNDRINAVHAVMLNTGKVLIMAGSGNDIGNFRAGRFESVVFDPANNTFKKIPTPYDMFCSGHYILPDGNVLIAGGTARYEVLADQIQYAAGVMTVANHSTRRVVLPAGTTFDSPTGQLYRARARTDPAAGPGAAPRQSPPAGARAADLHAGMGHGDQQRSGPGLKRRAPVHRPRRSGARGRRAAGERVCDQPRGAELLGHAASPTSSTFTPRRYQRVSDLNIARWYPTLVGLKDGNVLAVSGLNGFGQVITGQSEQFSLKTHRWTIQTQLKHSFPTYPALFLMPNGDLFFTGANAGYGLDTKSWRDPGIWNPHTNSFRPVTAGLQDPNELETAGSILLPPAQDQRYAVDRRWWRRPVAAVDRPDRRRRPRQQTAALEARRQAADRHPLPRGRDHPERRRRDLRRLALLPRHARIGPDDRAHVDAGQRSRSQTSPNPLVGRDYHSEGLLLPDGRILTLGGNPLFGNKSDTEPQIFHKQISIYSPPYLYHGSRPALTGGPSSLRRGETATFTTPDPARSSRRD